jgi:hypothetical protein
VPGFVPAPGREEGFFFMTRDSELTSKERSSMPSAPAAPPNPKRVLAGRANRGKRAGLSEEGRERLRQTALLHQPWRFSTGPRTAPGKARSAANGRIRQFGPRSVRQVRADLAGLRDLLREMREARAAADRY